ncbi:MAG: hypothetical protein ACR2KG_13545 [Nocardioidaceae bacterium]
MNITDQVANEVIRERTSRRVATQRPTHPRTARILRRLANRLEARS